MNQRRWERRVSTVCFCTFIIQSTSHLLFFLPHNAQNYSIFYVLKSTFLELKKRKFRCIVEKSNIFWLKYNFFVEKQKQNLIANFLVKPFIRSCWMFCNYVWLIKVKIHWAIASENRLISFVNFKFILKSNQKLSKITSFTKTSVNE